MIETSRKLARASLAAALALTAACSVTSGGEIPCADDASCPNDYPVCSSGKCVAGTSTSAISVAIVGVQGHADTDVLRGTVTVSVTARANAGVQSVTLTAGSKTYQPNASSKPPVYLFDVVTTDVTNAPGDVPLTATVTGGDGATASTPAFTVHVDNQLPTMTIALVGNANVADGTMVKFDVTTSESVSSIGGTVSGAGSGPLSEISAATGNVHHFGYAITSVDAEGAHDVTFSARDLAGNSNSSTSTAAFNVRHPFVFGALSVNTGHTVNEQAGALPAATAGTVANVSVTLPSSAVLGAAKPVFKLTSAGGAQRTLSVPTLVTGATTNTWNTSYQVVSGDNDGIASVAVSVSDVAGNTPPPATGSVVIDKSPPLASPIAGGGKSVDTVNNTVTFTTVASKRLQAATITSSNLDAGNCTCDGGACTSATSATPLVSCTVTVTHGAAAAPTVTLTLQDTLGNTSPGAQPLAGYQSSYTVVAPPVGVSLVASAGTITTGQSTTLTATFTGGTGKVLGNDGSSAVITNGGSITVAPTAAATTYTLAVTNAAGTIDQLIQTTINVVPPPVITSFSASPTVISTGGSTTLTGVFSGGTGSIDNGVGAFTSGASVLATPATSTTYTLTVTNAAGASVQARASVFVGQTVSVSLTAPAAPINPGATAALQYTIGANATTSAIDPGNITALTADGLAHTLNVTPSVTTTYTLTATNGAGQTFKTTATVTVTQPAVASFSGPAFVTTGTGPTLTAQFTPATATTSVAGCVGGTVTGTNPATRTFTCPAIAANTTYTLSVTLGTATDQATALVQVAPDPTTTSLAVVGGAINPGAQANLSGVGCAGCTVSFNPPITIDTGSVTGAFTAHLTTNPSASTLVTMSVTNQAGASATKSANVVVTQPSIASFTGPSAVTTGGAPILVAQFTPSTAVATVAGCVGGTVTGTAPASQTFTCGAITQNTTFTLVVTLGSSTATASVVVKVAPIESLTAGNVMNVVRFGASRTLLPNGKVLIAGGSTTADGLNPVFTAEVFDPASGNFLSAGGGAGCAGANVHMSDKRYRHTGTLLSNGKVLLVGGTIDGTAANVSATADLYDANADCFVPLGPGTHLNVARMQHVAAALPSGRVLIAGGTGSGGTALQSAEVFDPLAAANQFLNVTGTGSTLSVGRTGATATLLNNGLVLVAGGNTGAAAPADLFDYTANAAGNGQFSLTAGNELTRRFHTATLLGSGKVLLAGGSSDGTAANVLVGAELYDPNAASNAFTATTGSLATGRMLHTAVLMPAGTVLVAGGTNSSGVALFSTELFDPSTGSFTAAPLMSVARTQHVAVFLFNGSALEAAGVSPAARGDLFTP